MQQGGKKTQHVTYNNAGTVLTNNIVSVCTWLKI